MLLNDMHTDWDDEDNDTREGITTLHTNGSGYWSSTAKAVRVDKLGLIYTDKLFRQELRAYLQAEGYAGDDVDYSEQGMQGDNYVSCDVGSAFIASYMKKHTDFVIEQ
jgi:hypothetical protein